MTNFFLMKKIIAILLVVAAFSVFENAKAQYVTLPDTNFRNWFNTNGFSSCVVGNTLDTTKSLIINTTTLNSNAPASSAIDGPFPLNHDNKFAYNDLERRSLDLCSLLKSPSNPRTFNIISFLIQIPMAE